jgi:hypothetical protein
MGSSKDFSSEFDFFDEEKRVALFKGLYPKSNVDKNVEVLNTKRPNVLLILINVFLRNFRAF